MAKRPASVPHPQLAKSLQAWKARGGKTSWIASALDVTFEQARRYVEGKAMPRPSKMKRLAALIGISAAELQYGVKIDPRRTPPGTAMFQLANVEPEEQVLLETYRKLPPFAQEALRMRAAELLEEFGKKSEANPFGKGTQ